MKKSSLCRKLCLRKLLNARITFETEKICFLVLFFLCEKCFSFFFFSGVTLEVAQPECYEFSCDQVVQSDGTKHNGVGAGIAFKSLPDDKSSLCLFISGSLTCRTGWGVVGNSTLAPPLKQLNIVAPLSRSAFYA